MARANAPWFRASKGTWYITTADSRKVSLGVKGRENEKEAVKAWHRFMAGMPLETSPTLQERRETPPAVPKAVVSVQAVLDAFLDDCDGRVKSNSLRVYRQFFKAFKATHGKAEADALTPTLAESFARKQGWSASSQSSFLGALKAAFRWAVKSRLIARNSLDGLKRPPKRSRGADAVLTADEHERLMEHATPAFRLFLVVLHATGARPSEVAGITAENFNADAALVVLAEHKTAYKGKSRVIYLSPEIVALLAVQREKHPTGVLLRNNIGTPWTPSALVCAMASARKKAGIAKAICYSFRHTFATDALANGVPDAQVAELLGHSGTTMLHKHYAHLGARAKVLKSALERVR